MIYTLHMCATFTCRSNIAIKKSRQVDAQKFFDCLLTNIFEFQNNGNMFICGDFNSRCGEMLDFIQGVDNIEQRLVIDFTVNKYGHMFIDFLLNSNFCILNGRKCEDLNDFTCITSRGHSVVDYCIVSQDDVSLFSELKVTRASMLLIWLDMKAFLPQQLFPIIPFYPGKSMQVHVAHYR